MAVPATNYFVCTLHVFRYFYARVHLLNTTCQALTSDRIKYNQVKSAITKVFQDRFKQINNTFSPVVNQFKCANGPNVSAGSSSFGTVCLGVCCCQPVRKSQDRFNQVAQVANAVC